MTETTPAEDLDTAQAAVDLPDIGDTAQYEALMKTKKMRHCKNV